MKADYQAFIFEGYDLNQSDQTLTLRYSYDGRVEFAETLRFGFEIKPDLNPELLDHAIRGLWLAAGISYFKAHLAPQIIVKGKGLTSAEADFFNKLYRQGLGEFLVKNQLYPDDLALFPVDPTAAPHPRPSDGNGLIVPIGGGKDSLTSAGILSEAHQDFSTWTVNHAEQLKPQLDQIGKPHLQVDRRLDPKLTQLNAAGAYNGHIPISAYLAFMAVLTAVLTGNRDIALSNESSAGEGNLDYQGIEVNHQYSKTLEFERDFQDFASSHISPDIRYFSFLRPLSELRIAELFTGNWLDSYTGKFSSCNRNFSLSHKEGLTWCGECPKCAFVYLIFAPFVPKATLIDLFGRNLFEVSDLEHTYQELLGIQGHKPFECVGEIRECRQALVMARATGSYPELDRFKFPDPEYDYQSLSDHAMPEKYYEMLTSFLARQ